jgi:hypothetical protein
VGPSGNDVDALRRISIEDGVVSRPVPEPIGLEGEVERLVALEGDSGADGWVHQHSEAGLRSAARLLRTVHDASVGWEPPRAAVLCTPDVE